MPMNSAVLIFVITGVIVFVPLLYFFIRAIFEKAKEPNHGFPFTWFFDDDDD